MDKKEESQIEGNKIEANKKATIKVPFWCAVLTGSLVIMLVIAILYLQYVRYGLVSKAIDAKDVTSSALLLSPEIATGLVRIFGVL